MTKESTDIKFRFAVIGDVDLYYKWANDELVRKNSFSSEKIEYDDHARWFLAKIESPDCFLYLFTEQTDNPVGQVRIEKRASEIVIGISIDEKYRGRSLGAKMLNLATDDFAKTNREQVITAYIKVENEPSVHIFRKAGFGNEQSVVEGGCDCLKLIKSYKGR